jgi:multidrug efflux pump subunit AcrB
VLSTLLAEIYGPDPETRRKTAEKVREAFEVPFIVDIDDSFGQQMPRVRIAIDQDNLEYQKVEEGDVYDTLQGLYAQKTVGYSHRGGGRQPIPDHARAAQVGEAHRRARAVDARSGQCAPGDRGVVELGDVVSVRHELSSFPIFRHNGKPAEMVTAELAGAFEAPVYGMIEVGRALDQVDWTGLEKPTIALHGQPIDDSKPVLLWDGEWEVTWVTFRDMGGAFLVALLGIYILVVAQFGSFKVPLVILTPIPLTLIGIMFGHWLFGAPSPRPR